MATKDRKSLRKNVTKPAKGPNSKPLPLPSSLKDAIAIGIREISEGASDQQITQSLRDSGIELKKLPEDFIARLRGGASFKIKPKRAWAGKKSN